MQAVFWGGCNFILKRMTFYTKTHKCQVIEMCEAILFDFIGVNEISDNHKKIKCGTARIYHVKKVGNR